VVTKTHNVGCVCRCWYHVEVIGVVPAVQRNVLLPSSLLKKDW